MSKMKKLAIITTHPIQYYAPVFKLLHQRQQVSIKIFYTWGEDVTVKYDPGFNKIIEWDIPLLEGYPYEWVKNSSKDPGTHHFMGIVNPDLIHQVSMCKPDFILVYGWGFYSHLKIIRYFKNKMPVLFRGDSTLLDEKGGIVSLLKAIFLKWVYRHVDHAFYVGLSNKAYFLKYGLSEDQLSFAPHAIDNKRFTVQEAQTEAQSLRQHLNIKSDELIILFAGKLEEKKAPLQLLDAFLGVNIDSVHLLFVGNGPLEKQLKLKAKENHNVHFMDFQNQSRMPVVYRACDLFCLPSKGPGETWGLAINEAMACGKAILVSDKVGAAADLVKPGYNGAIFKALSQTDLIYNLNKLIANGKNELVNMGEHSKELIKDWSFENQVIAIEAVIKYE
jgi:glycosyltransferase involved in cell wall biosynthesis